MSWNYEIFSSKSLEDVEAIISEIEEKLENLEEESPDRFANSLCPQIDEATVISKKDYPKYLKSIRNDIDRPADDPLKISDEIETLFSASKTSVIVEGFNPEMEPLGASILKELLEKLSPAVAYKGDGWMTARDLLESMKSCKIFSLEAAPEEMKNEAEVDTLRAQLLTIIEKGLRSTTRRIEIERAFFKSSPEAQKTINAFLAPAPFSEKKFRAALAMDDALMNKTFSEIHKLLDSLNKHVKH